MIYLFSAYTLVWVALFAYILNLSSKQKKIDQELESLKKLLRDRETRTP